LQKNRVDPGYRLLSVLRSWALIVRHAASKIPRNLFLNDGLEISATRTMIERHSIHSVWVSADAWEKCINSVPSRFVLMRRLNHKQNLAYNEIRSVIVRILWNLDIEICPESRNWNDQKVWILWEKHPLNIIVSDRNSPDKVSSN
jgi:hypothetical protein